MPKKKSVGAKLCIPDYIRLAFDEYGFKETLKLEKAVSSRSANEWFAVLFESEDEDEGPFFAVDFRMGADSWEVQNDYVGPFDTIKEFETEPLTRTFI